MAVFLDQDSLVPALEQVAGSMTPVIKELGVNAVHLAHADGEIPVRRLDEKMVVVVHEAVSVAKPVVAFIDEAKDFEKGISVLVVFEYGFFIVASISDMINSAGVFYA